MFLSIKREKTQKVKGWAVTKSGFYKIGCHKAQKVPCYYGNVIHTMMYVNFVCAAHNLP